MQNRGRVMEFDHLFICVEEPAQEAERLVEFGLIEGSPNVHPGQGTANRRFFFHNSFIELLYATDHGELNSPLTKPTKLNERFPVRSSIASLFGLCFRPSNGNPETLFQSWSYRPDYLPKHLEVKVAKSPAEEPMWFYLSFGVRPDSAPEDKRQPIKHKCGFRDITSVKVCSPENTSMSEPATFVNGLHGVEFTKGKEHELTIEFDSGRQGMQKMFSPELPLVFRW